MDENQHGAGQEEQSAVPPVDTSPVEVSSPPDFMAGNQPKPNNLLSNKKVIGLIIVAVALVALVALIVVALVLSNNQRSNPDTSQYEIDNQLEEYRAVANDSAGTAPEIISSTEAGLKDMVANQNISPEQKYKAVNSLSGLYYNNGKYVEANRVMEEYLSGQSDLTDQQKLQVWAALASNYRKQNNISEQKKYLELIKANRDKADDEFMIDMYISWLDALQVMGY
ncbi:MAG: hypothetical protein LBU20_00495 [Candidatus Nomurabacteria bacterium]|jgi:hypothetical protein|nr:hypothetical protein [Candidatus Nomurabacteria bacterium]